MGARHPLAGTLGNMLMFTLLGGAGEESTSAGSERERVVQTRVFVPPRFALFMLPTILEKSDSEIPVHATRPSHGAAWRWHPHVQD